MRLPCDYPVGYEFPPKIVDGFGAYERLIFLVEESARLYAQVSMAPAGAEISYSTRIGTRNLRATKRFQRRE